MSDKNCCDTISKNSNGDYLLPGGMVAGATVMCCQGRKIVCVADKYRNRNIPGTNITLKCTIEHEDYHNRNHNPPCPDDCSVRLNYLKPGLNLNDSECEAFNRNLQCLRSRRHECGGNSACEKQVDQDITAIESVKRSRRCKN
jgi:hypothetical protein